MIENVIDIELYFSFAIKSDKCQKNLLFCLFLNLLKWIPYLNWFFTDAESECTYHKHNDSNILYLVSFSQGNLDIINVLEFCCVNIEQSSDKKNLSRIYGA